MVRENEVNSLLSSFLLPFQRHSNGFLYLLTFVKCFLKLSSKEGVRLICRNRLFISKSFQFDNPMALGFLHVLEIFVGSGQNFRRCDMIADFADEVRMIWQTYFLLGMSCVSSFLAYFHTFVTS